MNRPGGRVDEILTDEAPLSIGPYSQGITHNIRCTGQGPVHPDRGGIIREDVYGIYRG